MGIQIAGSLGELKPIVFRIGHLSRIQMETKNLASVLIGISSFLKEKNIPVRIEEAVKEL
jgi:aspartate aminotransferase-like enzyme